MPDHKKRSKSFAEEAFRRQQHEIEESIKYASYIQQALFPSHEVVKKCLPEHFIFYRPRDIVSGDFYYVACRNNFTFIAVGDCTGHGVPGAFMSILGITFLNEIISRLMKYQAGSILNYLREHVMKALSQTGDEGERKDGIDLALCVIDNSNGILDFAGAFNPVYVARNNRLIELNGDMMPVGIGAEEERPFTGKKLQLEEKDTIYLFTDGYADQFGGPHDKKFKHKPFRN